VSRALRRTLAATAYARADLVPFSRSAMDGFALRSADTARAPLVLQVTARVSAGDDVKVIERGCAVAIATGAALPAGADAVVPIEDVCAIDDTVAIEAPVKRGDNVFSPGQDARAGEALVNAGRTLYPGHLGLLAAAGHDAIAVVRRPRVAIVTAGDELVEVGVEPAIGQIRNSNATMLATFAAAANADVVSVVHVGDDREALGRALFAATGAADLTVTTGGASVGERDLLKSELVEVGFTLLFEAVAVRPGRPVSFAVRDGQRVAVLPGNPAAAYVTFAELVLPAIRRLAGVADALLPAATATLAGALRAHHGKTSFVFARVSSSRDGFVASVLADQCASLTRTAADANALIRLDPGERTFVAGERVRFDVLDPSVWSAAPTA
jgi:molybdopterin molybdotransferase